MIAIRRAAERGHTDWGWLDSRHTFSFGEYYDPRHMGYLSLRVMNDDRVKGGAGFGTHGHRDMEILSAPANGSIQLQQDVELKMARLGGGDERVHPLAPGRHAWVHVARGPVTLNGRSLDEGDSAALSDEPEVRLVGRGDAEVLLFDLA